MLSVVMSVYNEKISDIKKSIDSVLNQTYTNFEFIIILDNPFSVELDNCITSYVKEDNRINYYKNKKNVGLARSLNMGISYSKYNYIIRMDADDICYENRFETLVNNIDDYTDVYYSKYEIIDEQDNFLKFSERMPEKTETLKKILHFKNIICHPTVMIKKSSLISSGMYSNLKVSEDFELWVRMIKQNLQFKGINEVLLKYRIRESSMTTSDYYKSYFAIKYINYFYKNGVKNELLDNNRFVKSYKGDTVNKEKYNLFAKKYNKLVNNWNKRSINKFFSLGTIILREPLMFDYIVRTFIVKQLRKVD